jgi:hypothetical protein
MRIILKIYLKLASYFKRLINYLFTKKSKSSRKPYKYLFTKKSKPSSKPYKHLTPRAAKFMLENNLVMRNSFSEQLFSYHYKLNDDTRLDPHSSYCIPLWTIGTPAAFKSQYKLGNTNWSINKAALNQRAPFNIDVPDSHLNDFRERIAAHIRPFGPFGWNATSGFKFEVIIAAPKNKPYIDDIGRYSTGGRSISCFNQKTIRYRSTLNEKEINLLKDILWGKYDKKIGKICRITSSSDHVRKTVRYSLALYLATEILSSKITAWLNLVSILGYKLFHKHKIIAFNTTSLNEMLTDVLEQYAEEFKTTIKYRRTIHMERFNSYISSEWQDKYARNNNKR